MDEILGKKIPIIRGKNSPKLTDKFACALYKFWLVYATKTCPT
jgi:hypothetical protein